MRTPPKGPKELDPLAAECRVWPVSFSEPLADGTPCHYCGGSAEARDHIVPNVVGGADAWWNLVPSCTPCNNQKADRQPCSCLFCVRAMALWSFGFRRIGLTRAEKKRQKKARLRDAALRR